MAAALASQHGRSRSGRALLATSPESTLAPISLLPQSAWPKMKALAVSLSFVPEIRIAFSSQRLRSTPRWHIPLVSHVGDPLTVLKEMARVVKPGGMVGIFDGDYASMTFGSDDPVKGKAQDEAIIKAIVTNPRVMPHMPELLRDAGFDLIASFGHVVADIGKADFWAPAIDSFLRLLPKSGTMSDAEVQSWATSMRKRSEQGIFFGASNYYAYVARRR